MVPVRLKLSNFTSYGENPPELDFTKFKLAAISGLNGAGKSSLLDAITWCVWGTSRAGDSSDALIHSGADSMQVEFSFELDGHIYTIKRRRSKKAGGSTALELWSGSHNLTEGTIKATQEKIIQTLHLTFETFTNSSYLRQGHADEFTTKGPTERKRILADILGLDHYDRLEEKAKEKSKEAAVKLQLLDYQLLEIEAELSQKEEREKALSQAEEETKIIDKQLQEVSKLIKEIETEKEVISGTIKSLETKKLQVMQVRKELADLKLQLQLKETAKDEYQNILKQKEEIEKNYQVLQTLQEKRKQLETVRSELIKVKDQLAEVQKVLIQREEKRAQAIKELEIEIKKFQTENQEFQTAVDSLTKDKTICPTCKQAINEAKNKEIILENRDKILENNKKITDLSDKVKKYQEIILPESTKTKDLEKAVKILEEDSKDWFEITQKINGLEKFADLFIKLQQAQTAIKTHQETILDLQKNYADKEKQILESEKELDDLIIFDNKLKEVREKLEAQETIKQQLSQKALSLSGQVGEAKQLVSRSKQLEGLQENKKTEKQKLTTEKTVFEELALAFGKKGIQAMIIEAAIPEIEEEANMLLGKLSEGRMKIMLQTQRETKTLRPSGSGQAKEHGIVETLDIIISDEMGERPYEMYSVAGDELVYIRQNGNIKSIPIQELWSAVSKIEYKGEYQLQATNIEALCYVDGEAVWQKVDKILRHKSPQKIMEVTCGPGNYTVKLTKNHSVYVLTPEGLKVKKTEDLQHGDYLLSPRIIPQDNQINQIDLTEFILSDFINQRESKNKSLKWDDHSIWSRIDQKINRYVNLNFDWSKFVGICVAEGSGQNSYSIAAGTDSHMATEALRIASQSFGTLKRSNIFVSAEAMKTYIQNNPGVSSISPKAQYRPLIGGRLVAHILKNMVGNKAEMKKIPSFIFNSSKEIKLAFLTGLIDGDGHLSCYPHQSKSQVAITTISRRLVGEIIFLCRQLGIWARIENHGEKGFRRGMNHQKSYRIVISGKKNLEILGLGQIVSKHNGVTKYEGIPYDLIGTSRIDSKRFPRAVDNQYFSCGVRRIPQNVQEAYIKIQRFVKDWNILEVKEIKEINSTSEYVYDLMVPNNNSFVAGNGAILVHNSGGETFRVNFAIRLAISRLLTHRAGAKLQFLVIDEGFGTQDAPGRARLVEAIDTIKDDFEKIVVITHIEELKEEFPVRIEVSKNSAGSTFEVVGI